MQALIQIYISSERSLYFKYNIIKSYTNKLHVLSQYYLHLSYLSLIQATTAPSLIYWNNLFTNLSKCTLATLGLLIHIAYSLTFRKTYLTLTSFTGKAHCLHIILQGSACPGPCPYSSSVCSVLLDFFLVFLQPDSQHQRVLHVISIVQSPLFFSLCPWLSPTHPQGSISCSTFSRQHEVSSPMRHCQFPYLFSQRTHHKWLWCHNRNIHLHTSWTDASESSLTQLRKACMCWRNVIHCICTWVDMHWHTLRQKAKNRDWEKENVKFTPS